MHAQPPGPGFPIHDPSVISCTFFIWRSGGNCFELVLEKSIYAIQNLGGFGGLVDFYAQFRSVADPMGEIGGELLHLTYGVRRVALAEHLIVRAHNLVALLFGGMLIAPRLQILPNLPENPRIRRGRTADHHRVAACFLNHVYRVLRPPNPPFPTHTLSRVPDLHLFHSPPTPFSTLP